MSFQFNHSFRKLGMAALGRLGGLRICSAGVVGVVTAMVLPVLLGFTSLGVEIGHWYLAQRQMQGAADAAAISAAAQYIADYNDGRGELRQHQWFHNPDFECVSRHIGRR
jgi:Flp pilus assembly protein TadG